MVKIERGTIIDSIRSTIRKGAHAAGRGALDAVTHVLFTTTTITGHQLFDRFTRLPTRETIRGGDADEPYKDTDRPEGFDTTRQVSLYHHVKDDDPDGTIYLETTNLADHASCSIERQSRYRYEKDRLATVPLKVAIDGTLQDTNGDYPSWRITQGQTLQAWIGGDSFAERDTAYGDATVIWTPPPVQAR